MQSKTGDGMDGCVGLSPTLVLTVTLLASIAATGLLCTAFMTDRWEELVWHPQKLNSAVAHVHMIRMHGEQKVFRIDIPAVENWAHLHRKNHSIFLVPMRGGIWSLCIDLTSLQIKHLGPFGRSKLVPCLSYLEQDDLGFSGPPTNALGSHRRMQNLTISCALVCFILLGTAALLGIFGLSQRQNSALLITGVIYLLAALFALFASTILILKRRNAENGTDFDGIIANDLEVFPPKIPLIRGRVVTYSWSLDLAWCGIILCTFASFMWLLLSKIYRYTSSAFAM